jgi:hypothetical protein
MQFVRCQQPFSTADAESVEVHLVDENLEVRFLDWRKRPVQLRFPGVVAFRWDPLAVEGAPRDDEPYEVLESPWVASLVAENQCGERRHFKLCFNAASVLDVVAEDIRVSSAEAEIPDPVPDR